MLNLISPSCSCKNAAETGLPQAISNREILAVNMTAADIQRAQELARQPLEIHQKPSKLIETPPGNSFDDVDDPITPFMDQRD